jgi:hypothetical protein
MQGLCIENMIRMHLHIRNLKIKYTHTYLTKYLFYDMF